MNQTQNTAIIKSAWAHLGAGELDELASLYSDDMAFILPGQNDQLNGRQAFRSALDGIGEALPPGFEITEMRYFEGDGDVVNVVAWKSNSIPEGTQSSILWKFNEGGEITEERWFVDTEQWKSSF
jgi:ketosteroid isomerase-like protein